MSKPCQNTLYSASNNRIQCSENILCISYPLLFDNFWLGRNMFSENPINSWRSVNTIIKWLTINEAFVHEFVMNDMFLYSLARYLSIFTVMKVGYDRICGSTPRMLNWAAEEYQLDGAVGSGHAIWKPPVASRGKATDRFMLFWHLSNMLYLDFYYNCSFFYCILQATLRRYPRVKNMFSAEFHKSAKDFHRRFLQRKFRCKRIIVCDVQNVVSSYFFSYFYNILIPFGWDRQTRLTVGFRWRFNLQIKLGNDSSHLSPMQGTVYRSWINR